MLLLVGCTVYSPISSFFFFGAIAAGTLWEFGTLVNKYAGASVTRPINAMAGFVLVAAVWLFCIGSITAPKMLGLYGLMLLYLLISELYRRAENPLLNWAYAFASQLYIALPISLLPMLSISYSPDGQLSYNWIYPLALFIFVWTNDTGAYLFGCSLQRFIPYKLFPRISPKKSWIGSVGGGLLTLAASALIWYLEPETFPLLKWLGFAMVVVVAGTWGDLVESLIKRHMGIKDSGQILPGHGGFLDRFDSALLVIPAVVIYLVINS